MFTDRILSLDSLHVFSMSAQVLATQASTVADVGCGRGAFISYEHGRAWQDLRGEGRTVIGIDVDPVGAENPALDEFRLIPDDGRWPLDDGSIDLAVCDFVLEHVEKPDRFVAELTRTLRPGGAFVARTVSRASPLSIVARLIPNKSHAGIIGSVQPGRHEKDVFHTAYQMNTRRDLAQLLDRDFEWAAASRTGLDQYLIRWPRLGRVVVSVERRLPRSLQTALVICARKRS
jgi:SAM-dependent methyltransferase